MSTYATTRQPESTSKSRERILSGIAGALGILMYAWGFLRWLNVGDGTGQRRFSGYAFEMPTTAVIGLSLAAGLMALLGALDRRAGRGVPGAVPTALAATSLLLAVAIFLGKGSISPTLGSKVGVEVGLILALCTAAAQTVVLGLNLASRHSHDDTNDHADTRRFDAARGASAYPAKT